MISWGEFNGGGGFEQQGFSQSTYGVGIGEAGTCDEAVSKVESVAAVLQAQQHVAGGRGAVDKGGPKRVEANEMIRVKMAQEAGQRRGVVGLGSEIVDADVWEFWWEG